MAGLVGKKFKHKHDDTIETVEVLQEAAMDKVFTKVTYKKSAKAAPKLETFSLSVLEEK